MPGARDGQGADPALAAALRRYAARPDRAAREPLASLLVTYTTDYLGPYLRHRRFGFRRPIAEVAIDVADASVSALLPEIDAGCLIDGLCRLLPRTEACSPGQPDLGSVSDADLVAAAKHLLRLRAQRGATAEWKRENPEQARVLRALKSRIRRTHGIDNQRSSRGHLIITSRSELCRPALDLEGIVGLLRDLPPPYRIGNAVETIARRMTPDAESGGYCFRMDLTRAIHRLRLEAMMREVADSGTTSWEGELRIGRDGIPFSIKIDRFTQRLTAWAEEILRADAAKRRRLNEPRGTASPTGCGPCDCSDLDSRNDAGYNPGLDHAAIAIAIDRILAPVDLGKPVWQEVPLEKLIDSEMGLLRDPAARAARIHRVDYLIRRLRARMRSHWRETL